MQPLSRPSTSEGDAAVSSLTDADWPPQNEAAAPFPETSTNRKTQWPRRDSNWAFYILKKSSMFLRDLKQMEKILVTERKIYIFRSI